MPLPSFFIAPERERAWSVPRAAAYGAAIGAVAASLKTLAPLVGRGASGFLEGHWTTNLVQIGVATFAFAVLCAAAAALRNFISRQLVWREER
jgi:hypothetical protein